jgi:hypothetical protein
MPSSGVERGERHIIATAKVSPFYAAPHSNKLEPFKAAAFKSRKIQCFRAFQRFMTSLTQAPRLLSLLYK